MQLSKIYAVLVTLTGAVNIFFGYKRLTSFSGKILSKFDKIEEVTLVLLISGIVCLVVGILQLADRK